MGEMFHVINDIYTCYVVDIGFNMLEEDLVINNM